MRPVTRNLRRARFLLVTFWGLLIAAAAAAPYLAAHSHSLSASVIYLLMSPVCHQDPGRSFHWLGLGWALCHRCSGIYAGILLGSAFSSRASRWLALPGPRRLFVVSCSLPVLLDAFLSITGLWINTPCSRIATGALFGVMLGTLMLAGLSEVLGSLNAFAARAHSSH
jgi:uncharacterized membrane protein